MKPFFTQLGCTESWPSCSPVVSSRVEVLEVCGEVDLPRGEEEEDDDDELQHEHVGQAHAHGQAVSLDGREGLVRFVSEIKLS